MKMAIRMIRSSVSKAAEFDIRLLSPIEHADRCVGTLTASIDHLALMYSLFLFLLFPQSAILNRLFFFLLLYSCLLLSPHFLITFLSIHFFLSLPVFFPLLVIFLPCLLLTCLLLPWLHYFIVSVTTGASYQLSSWLRRGMSLCLHTTGERQIHRQTDRQID